MSTKPTEHHSWDGKRVLITWTDEAYHQGADWIAFLVVKETDDGLFLKGCDAPDGSTHDGTHCFAKNDEIRDICEWITAEGNQRRQTEVKP